MAEQPPIGGLVICELCLASVTAATGLRATADESLALTTEQRSALLARRKVMRKALAHAG